MRLVSITLNNNKMELRHFDDSSPSTMAISAKTSPLIKFDGNGVISYYVTINEKVDALENRSLKDKFLISWCGRWKTDVFEITEEDIHLILNDYKK